MLNFVQQDEGNEKERSDGEIYRFSFLDEDDI